MPSSDATAPPRADRDSSTIAQDGREPLEANRIGSVPCLTRQQKRSLDDRGHYPTAALLRRRERSDRRASKREGSEKTYFITTYGCQMNEHDSERLAGLLEAEGYVRASKPADASVVLFNTCCIRENADNKLYGNLGHMKAIKDTRPDMKLVVGGCLAQKDKSAIQNAHPGWMSFSEPTTLQPPRLLEESNAPRLSRSSSRRRCSLRVAEQKKLTVARVGVDLDRVQHRAPSASCRRSRRSRGEPATRRHRERSRTARGRRCGRGDAARPECELLRARSRRDTYVCEAA